MTRVNLVDPEDLHNKHLIAEIHEVTRIFGLVRKAQERGINKYNFKEKTKAPDRYVLGTGHVKFFFDKLLFVARRYESLCDEAISRGYKINKINRNDLLQGVDTWWQKDYIPTQEAIALNKQRIAERTNPNWK